MRRSMILAGACAVVAVACLGGGGLFFVERPTIVRVAVPDENHGDYALLSAASKVVRHNHHPMRFKLVSTPDAKAAGLMMEATRERGLLIGKGGLYGNVLRMAPPMTLTDDESREGLDLLVQALSQVQGDLHGTPAIPTAQGAPA